MALQHSPLRRTRVERLRRLLASLAVISVAAGALLALPQSASAGAPAGADSSVTVHVTSSATDGDARSTYAVLILYSRNAQDTWQQVDTTGLALQDDVDNEYAFSGLPAGQYYVVAFSSSDLELHSQPQSEEFTLTGAAGSTFEFDADLHLVPTFNITGTVSPHESGILVEAYVQKQTVYRSNDFVRASVTSTAEDGSYTLAVPVGASYTVAFKPQSEQNLVASVYPNIAYPYTTLQGAVAGSTDVSAANATGINAALQAGHTISGTVSAGASTEASGTVIVYSADSSRRQLGLGYWSRWGDSNGTYSVTGLPVGDYVVMFETYGDFYSEFYDGVIIDPRSADQIHDPRITPVTLTAADRHGIDADLAPKLHLSVSGTVLDTAGAPTSNAQVYLRPASGTGSISMASVQNDGTYHFDDVVPGDYFVLFQPFDSETSTQIYPNIDIAGTIYDEIDTSKLTPIHVSTTSLTSVDGHFHARKYYDIAGDITAPLANNDQFGSLSSTLEMYSNGTWSSRNFSSGTHFSFTHLDPGTYRVVINGGTTYGYSILPVVLTTASKTDLKTTLVQTVKRTVTGTVKLPANGPAATSVSVSAYQDIDGHGSWRQSLSSSAVNVINGTYSLQLADGTYRIGYSDYSGVYKTHWYESVDSEAPATNVVGATAVTVSANRTLAAVTLAKKSTVSGVISDSNGPVAGVQVVLQHWSGYGSAPTPENGYWNTVSSAITAPDGSYTVTGAVPGDTYTLSFQTGNSNSVGADGYLGGTGTLPQLADLSSSSYFVFNANRTLDYTLSDGLKSTGTVLSSGTGSGLAGATLQFYRWDSMWSDWVTSRQVTTAGDGSYSVVLPTTGSYTARISHAGYDTAFLGGGTALPTTAPTDANSISFDGTHAVVLPSKTLAVHASAFGTVAGQSRNYCFDNSLPAGDDQLATVDLGWTANFFGEQYSSVVVSTNGQVGLGGFPDLIPDLKNGSYPVLAPFGADATTAADFFGSSAADRGSVSYGLGDDGTLCVVWNEVAALSSNSAGRNTFQLLMTPRGTAGNFDVTYNYDSIQWADGTRTQAGYSAGTPGVANSSYVIEGSGTSGALVNGGPKSLITHRLDSDVSGRYSFSFTGGAEAPTYGTLAGHVQTDAGAPVVGAWVTAARGSQSFSMKTDSTGDYAFPQGSDKLRTGTYRISVYPTDGSFSGGTTVDVHDGQLSTADAIVLHTPTPPAADVSITAGGSDVRTTDAGLPVIFYGDPFKLSVANVCAGGSVEYSISLLGTVERSGTLTDTDGDNTFTATVAALYPLHGEAVISYVTTCPGVTDPVTTSFDVYIDPSGIVVDQYGDPIAGATVTLSRATTANGTYEPVLTGSSYLSPSTPTSPIITGDDGRFQWDVAPGAFYKVKVELAGSTTYTSAAMAVTPARTGLVIRMDRPSATAPVPTTAPQLIGSPTIGSTLTYSGGAWTDGRYYGDNDITWYRDGTAIATGSLYTVRAADAGHTLSVQLSVNKTVVGKTDGVGDDVDFVFAYLPARTTVGFVALGTITAGTVSITGGTSVGSRLTANVGAWLPDTVDLDVEWLRNGTPIATGSSYVLTDADASSVIAIRVTGSTPGYVTKVAYSAGRTIDALPAQNDNGGSSGGGTSSTSAGTSTATGTSTIAALLVLKPGKPKVTGTAKVGKTLKLAPGTWPKGTKLTYQWYANGKAIKKSTKASLKLAASLKGKKLTVKVTAKKSGYSPVVKTVTVPKKVKK